MFNPLTEKQIFENLSPCFHDDFRTLNQTHIQPNEQIYATFNASFSIPQSYEERKFNSNNWGYVVFTTYRRLLIMFGELGRDNEEPILYFKRNIDGKFWDKDFRSRTDNRYWFAPSVKPLSEYNYKNRYFREHQLANLKNVRRFTYSVEYKGSPIKLAEFQFTDVYTVFDEENGKLIYSLLQYAIQYGGSLASNQETNLSQQDIPQLLEALAKLLESGIITQDEFEDKKKEFLSRL